MTIKELANFLINAGTEFQGDDGYFDKAYIMHRFGLTKDDWTKLITEMSAL